MQDNLNGGYEFDIFKIIGLVLKKFYIVLLCAFLGGVAGFGYGYYTIHPIYRSSAYIYVNNSTVNLSSLSVSRTSISTDSLVSTYQVILKTRNTLETVIKKADLNYNYKQLSGMISSTEYEGTAIIQITVTDSDPEEACLIANTIAEVFPDKVNEIVNGTTAKIVDYAVVDTTNISASKVTYAMYGLAIGAVLACALIVLLDMLDDTIREENYLVTSYEVPIIGTIPNLMSEGKKYYKDKTAKTSDKSRYSYDSTKKDRSDSKENNAVICEKMHFEAREAYKLLRTNLQFALNDKGEGCKVLGVTSAIRGEGKSTNSCNLAYTIAQASQKVLLIDGDLRLPSIGNKLNIKSKYGLSDLIIGKADIGDVIYAYNEKTPNFHILLSGTIPPNPSELLNSNSMKEVIEKLKLRYDYIIIDLPPVNIVTDALVTKDYVDGLVVTVRQNYSVKGEVNDCVRSIEFIDANMVGIIFTNVDENRAYYNPKVAYNKYNSYKYKYSRYGKRYYNNRDYRYGYQPNNEVKK